MCENFPPLSSSQECGSCPTGPVCVVCFWGSVRGNCPGWPLRHAVTQASEGVGLWLTVSPLPGVASALLPCLHSAGPLVEPPPLPSTGSQGRSVCSRRGRRSPWCKWCLDGLPGAPFRESGQALGSLVPAILWVLCRGSRWPSPSTSTPRQMLCNHLRGPGHSPSQERELHI